MNDVTSNITTRDGFWACLFLAILSAALALPSLWHAWWHDPYSSGGFAAFVLWLAALGIAGHRLRRSSANHVLLWIVVAAFLCVVGSMTSLRICHHLAFAVALGALAVPAKCSGMFVLAGLSWMPATGWLISRFLVGGMAGWERPLMASSAAALAIICLHHFSKPTNSNASHL